MMLTSSRRCAALLHSKAPRRGSVAILAPLSSCVSSLFSTAAVTAPPEKRRGGQASRRRVEGPFSWNHAGRRNLPTSRPYFLSPSPSLSAYQFTSPFSTVSSSTSSSDSFTKTNPYFSKLLVANRGEIALRIIRTCNRLNIPTLAIYSTADRNAVHVKAATESICVGPPSSLESYLNIDKILDIIQTHNVDAVHPGYGFLSENIPFRRMLSELPDPVAFLGPGVDAMIALGDKIQSKIIASEAGVNTIPGYNGVITSAVHAVQIANDVGYPVMIKASAGGGGKGMRICYNDAQVREGYNLSKAEAASFFKDDRLLIERYIEEPHHIEFQILAGRKKTEDGRQEGELDVLVFPERECSIQRRNQKILEESPSALLTPRTRAKMAQQVRSLIQRVNYESAGTVEFLVDSEQNFYFLEMNTRLQVEHPITECITGVDLVEGMIRIAAGWGIPDELLARHQPGSTNDDEGRTVPFKGHAIEARVYAEDPLRGFLPSTGPLLKYIEPPTHVIAGSGFEGVSSATTNNNDTIIRVDSGVVEGSLITPYYDPMISKLVSYSPLNRAHAIDGLINALDRYVIHGVRHNTSFVSDVLRNDDFVIKGNTPTNFINLHYPNGFHGVTLTDREKMELCVIVYEIGMKRQVRLGLPPFPLLSESGEKKEEDGVVVCLGGLFGETFLVKSIDGGKGKDGTTPGAFVVKRLETSRVKKGSDGKKKEDKEEGSDKKEEGEKPMEVAEVRIDEVLYEPADPIADVVIDGIKRYIQVAGEDNMGQIAVKMYGADVSALIMSPKEYELSLHMHEPHILDMSGVIQSPMPGTLISYAVEEGDHVEVGQELCIVEAMKMQNVIRSPREGIIATCHAPVGSSLRADQVIIEFAPEDKANVA